MCTQTQRFTRTLGGGGGNERFLCLPGCVLVLSQGRGLGGGRGESYTSSLCSAGWFWEGSVKPCTPSAQPASQPAPEQSGLEHGIPAERINPQR